MLRLSGLIQERLRLMKIFEDSESHDDELTRSLEKVSREIQDMIKNAPNKGQCMSEQMKHFFNSLVLIIIPGETDISTAGTAFATPEGHNLLLSAGVTRSSSMNSTSSDRSQNSSGASGTSRYETVILGNRALKNDWRNKSLDTIAIEINDCCKEQFRALALAHAPFIIELRFVYIIIIWSN